MHAMLRVAFHLGTDLQSAVVQVNNQLADWLADDRFITAFIGLLDPATHRLRYHSAGQAPIGRCEASGSAFRNGQSQPMMRPRTRTRSTRWRHDSERRSRTIWICLLPWRWCPSSRVRRSPHMRRPRCCGAGIACSGSTSTARSPVSRCPWRQRNCWKLAGKRETQGTSRERTSSETSWPRSESSSPTPPKASGGRWSKEKMGTGPCGPAPPLPLSLRRRPKPRPRGRVCGWSGRGRARCG